MISRKITEELLNSINDYYKVNDLVGAPMMYQMAYEALDKIVEEKLKQTINKKLPLDVVNLFSDLKLFFKDFEIVSDNRQFPSYSFAIELKNKTIDYITIESYIQIKISLVYPCFTVFYEEKSFYENFSKFRPINFRILSSMNGNIDLEKGYLNTAISLVKRHFSDFEYFNHQMLFFNKLPNIFPYNYHEDNYTGHHYLYEFLFDDAYNSGNIEVAF